MTDSSARIAGYPIHPACAAFPPFSCRKTTVEEWYAHHFPGEGDLRFRRLFAGRCGVEVNDETSGPPLARGLGGIQEGRHLTRPRRNKGKIKLGCGNILVKNRGFRSLLQIQDWQFRFIFFVRERNQAGERKVAFLQHIQKLFAKKGRCAYDRDPVSLFGDFHDA